ncbi:hypothetical protein LZ32DRAFT_274345 [Colletotrichum eremochloae]|nr:hypothetical protein LZ32DRAFT_274345 [Colletotrichum eremochloae]
MLPLGFPDLYSWCSRTTHRTISLPPPCPSFPSSILLFRVLRQASQHRRKRKPPRVVSQWGGQSTISLSSLGIASPVSYAKRGLSSCL